VDQSFFLHLKAMLPEHNPAALKHLPNTLDYKALQRKVKLAMYGEHGCKHHTTKNPQVSPAEYFERCQQREEVHQHNIGFLHHLQKCNGQVHVRRV